MRKYLFHGFIALLFSSCSVTNDKYNALNDYLETIEKNSNKGIYVAREKINSNYTIEIFKLNEIQAFDSKGNITTDAKLFKEKDFEKLKGENPDPPIQDERIWATNKYWNKNDFKHDKIIFESMNTKTGIESIIEKYDKSNICVYSFSEPIYYQNKKYLVFTNYKICIAGGSSFVVIMQKIKGKWIRTHEAFNLYSLKLH
jgi:hypothetical protein